LGRKKQDEPEDLGEWEAADEFDEPVDLDNIEALIAVTKPIVGEYDVELISGAKITAKFYVQGQTASMEALNGMNRLKEGEAIKVKRERTVYVRRLNPQLINIQLEDDPHAIPRKGMVSPKNGPSREVTFIPLHALSIRGYLDLQEAVFPGSNDRNEDITARVNAARGVGGKGLPRTNAESSLD
jgi:hypothetical protein